MAKPTPKKQKGADAYNRILGALHDGRKAQRRLSELSDAIDDQLPPEELAKILAETVKDKKANSKDRMMCLGYILSVKKFHEKNDVKLEDEDLNSVEQGQLASLLSVAGNMAIVDAQRILNADKSHNGRAPPEPGRVPGPPDPRPAEPGPQDPQPDHAGVAANDAAL